MLKPTLGLFILGKAPFIETECSGVIITASVDHSRGVLYVSLAQYDKAEGDFQKAHELDPSQSLSAAAQGLAAAQENDLDRALTKVQASLAQKPNDALLLYLEADILSQKGADPGTPERREEPDLASAQANASLAGTTAKRWQSMLGSDSVSRQEAEEKAGDFTTKQAMVNAAQANVDRVQAMKGFTRIVAPFDGIVTARNTDVGALINAGGGTGPELFAVSDTRRLRVYVSVPQSYASIVKVGAKAKLTVPEQPGKTYAATVESSSRAVTVASGTMLIQLAVDNAASELLPGGFANVSLEMPLKAGGLSIPPSALMFDKSGLRVATVGADDKVLLKRVTISRDLGKVIELGSGIAASDRVIESPPDGIADGDLVRIAKSDAKK